MYNKNIEFFLRDISPSLTLSMMLMDIVLLSIPSEISQKKVSILTNSTSICWKSNGVSMEYSEYGVKIAQKSKVVSKKLSIQEDTLFSTMKYNGSNTSDKPL